jgi:site-specific recombinase XerD
MSHLVTLQNSLPAHLTQSIEQARELIAARHSAATRKAYETDTKAFGLWARANGLECLPASIEAVVLYLTHLSVKGLKPSSITRKVAAIKHSHRQAGHQSPTDSEPVKAAMAGIKRTRGTAPRQVNPATIEVVEKLLATCDESLSGHRDKALIAIGFGAALRRSELAGLKVEDIQVTDKGLVIRLPKSKTDQDAKGQEVAVLDGSRLQVKRLLGNWLEVSGILAGQIFPMTDRNIANIIKARAKTAGLDAAQFSGHSLRAGFLTSAANAGADLFRMMDVSRHRSINTVRGYVRKAQQFDNHAGSAFM